MLSLPRSRSTWLSVALTTERGICYHDSYADRDVAKIQRLIAEAVGDYVGIVDTGLIRSMDALKNFSCYPLLVIRRAPDEVHASMVRIGYDSEDEYEVCASRLLTMPWEAPKLVIHFNEIDSRGDEIWSHCIGDGFDPERWKKMCAIKIETRLA